MKKGYIELSEIQMKYNLGVETVRYWIKKGVYRSYKDEKTKKIYVNESDILLRIHEVEYSVAGISKKSGHGEPFIRRLYESGKLDFYKTETGKIIFPVGTENVVKDLFEKSRERSELRQFLSEHNRRIVKSGKLDEYHVAKLDQQGKILDVYINRNQAVRAHFKSKNLTDKEIQYKYLVYNGALYNIMLDGRRWYGHFYKYVSNTLEPTEVFPTAEEHEYILVNSKGEETVFDKKKDIVIDMGVSMSCIHTGFIDTGKTLPKTDYSVYTKGKTMEFGSIKNAIAFYRIGKDKFKKLWSSKSPIRGQQVVIKK
jgi:hypothetical protein